MRGEKQENLNRGSRSRRRRGALVVGVIVLLLQSICAEAEDPGGASQLAAALRRHYRLTTSRLTKDGQVTLQAGTVLTVRKNGILSFKDADSLHAALCPTHVWAGVVRPPHSATCQELAAPDRKMLKVSQTVCVTALDVRARVDTLSMLVASCVMNEAHCEPGTDRAMIIFHVGKGALNTSSPKRLEAMIDQALSEQGARGSAISRTEEGTQN
jgi:hypothetical protein